MMMPNGKTFIKNEYFECPDLYRYTIEGRKRKIQINFCNIWRRKTAVGVMKMTPIHEIHYTIRRAQLELIYICL